MNKPILFLTSSNLMQIENLYFLRDLGTVLNFEDKKNKDADIQAYAAKQFIICNMKDSDQVALLRFINMDNVHRVAVIRKGESCTEAWILKLKADYTIKDFDFVKDVSNLPELWNYIKALDMFKKPDANSVFYAKKTWSFLSACFSSSK